MASSASSALVEVRAPLDPKAHWITPDEQLRRLTLPVAEKIDKISGLIPGVADIVASYVPDSKLTSWHTGLMLIERLPKKIPPLPRHIHQILNSPCPKKVCSKMKPDGTFYMIREKCTLMLVPEELETLNKFERVVKIYGEKQYPENENPLQFRFFWNRARQEHGDIPFEPTHWVLHTDDVLETSRDKSYQEQADLVHSLAQETFVDWEVPNLRDTIATTFLKKIATGESVYQEGNDQNGNIDTFTRVKEATHDRRLAAGHFAPAGLSVSYYFDGSSFDYHHFDVGVAALRRF